jgi:hypothetical protein
VLAGTETGSGERRLQRCKYRAFHLASAEAVAARVSGILPEFLDSQPKGARGAYAAEMANRSSLFLRISFPLYARVRKGGTRARKGGKSSGRGRAVLSEALTLPPTKPDTNPPAECESGACDYPQTHPR